MIIVLSVAFFPVVYANCCTGLIECLFRNFYQ